MTERVTRSEEQPRSERLLEYLKKYEGIGTVRFAMRSGLYSPGEQKACEADIRALAKAGALELKTDIPKNSYFLPPRRIVGT